MAIQLIIEKSNGEPLKLKYRIVNILLYLQRFQLMLILHINSLDCGDSGLRASHTRPLGEI